MGLAPSTPAQCSALPTHTDDQLLLTKVSSSPNPIFIIIIIVVVSITIVGFSDQIEADIEMEQVDFEVDQNLAPKFSAGCFRF